MAYLQDDQNKKKDEELAGGAAGPDETSINPPLNSSGGGASGAPAGGGGSGAAPGTPPGGQRTFRGIQDYLSQNRPATQRLSQKVSDKVGGLGQSARQTLADQSAAFGERVKAGTAQADEGLLSGIVADPTKVDANRVKSLRDASYSGPDSFDASPEFEPVAKAFRDAQQTRDRLGSSEGRQQVLAGLVPGNQRISRGRLALDEALLATDPDARAGIESARLGQKGLEADLAAGQTAAREGVSKAQTDTLAARDAVRGALGQSRSQFETGLEQRLAQARTQANQRSANARSVLGAGTHLGLRDGDLYDISAPGAGAEKDGALASDELIARTGMSRADLIDAMSGSVNAYRGPGALHTPGGRRELYLPAQTAEASDEVLADLGIDRDIYDVMRGAEVMPIIEANRAKGLQGDQVERLRAVYDRALGDPSRFLQQGNADSAITRANVASADDYARQAALNDLSGDAGNSFLNQADAGQAGTANLDLSELDAGAMRQAALEAIMSTLSESGRLSGVNARSGGDTFIKKHGRKAVAPVGVDPVVGKYLAPGADKIGEKALRAATGDGDFVDRLLGNRESGGKKGLKLTDRQRNAIRRELE